MTVAGPAVREMPFSLEAERACLGATLIAPSKMPELVAGLETDDFLLPAHREIFDGMKALDAADKPIEILLLGDELKRRGVVSRLDGGESYLLDLANAVPTAENVGYYIRVVRDKSTLRRIVLTAAEIWTSAYGDFSDVQAFLAEASEKLTAISLRRSRSGSFTPFRADVDAAVEQIEYRTKHGGAISGIRTGVSKLDGILGGLQRQNVYVIAARPGIGKTALALNIGLRHARYGERARTLIFSLEMPRMQLMDRIFAAAVPMDHGTVKSGIDVDWRSVHGEAGRLAALGIQIVDDQYTPAEIEATAHRYRAAHPDDDVLIILDYLQLAEIPHVKGENQATAVGRFSTRLKRMAKKLNLPLVLLSQLNRDVEKDQRRPRLSDLRESGAIEQDADVVIFIHDEMVKLDDGAKVKTEDGPIELIVAKNRHGQTGFTKARWMGRYCSFYDLDRDSSGGTRDAAPVDDDERGWR